MAAPLTLTSIDAIKEVFPESSVKFLVLGSLLLQVLLLCLGTFRKRSSNPLVPYLVLGVNEVSSNVADVAFSFTVAAKLVSPAKMPFGLWAAFMLLHKAGQERLTVYSLNDYEDRAWLKFFKNTILLYVFHFLTGMHRGGRVPLVEFSIFSIAIIRLFARTLRLLLAMWEVNREQPLLDSFLLSLKDDHEQRPLSSSDNQHSHLHSVLDARSLLKSTLRSIADIQQPSPSGLETVGIHFANNINPKHAMRTVEVEHSLIFESFYTDGIFKRYLGSRSYRIYAFLCSYAWVCCAISLITFTSLCTREHYSAANYNATCILLWGTLILEVLSYLMMVVSDWTIASLGQKYGGRVLLLIAPHKLHWLSDFARVSRVARVLFGPWSETIPRFNYLAYGMNQPVEKLWDNIRLGELTGGVSVERYTDELGMFIFEKLRFLLNNGNQMVENNSPVNVFKFHIISEMLYQCYEASDHEQEQDMHRKYSKLISEYMAYLLFQKACYFKSWQKEDPYKEIKQAWRYIKKVAPAGASAEQCLNTVLPSITGLSDWTYVANIIEAAYYERDSDGRVTSIRWNVISEKWIELLLLAAIKCEPIEHVRELCNGGQLASHVWLLALHFGFSSSSQN